MIAPKIEIVDIQTLFNNNLGKTRFLIPIYQRDGAWSIEESRKFYDDYMDFFIEYHKNGKSQEEKSRETHFLGAIYLADNKDVPEKTNLKVYDVVDGQQRITMITLFACAIKRALHAYFLKNERTLGMDEKKVIEKRLRNMNAYLYYDLDMVDLKSENGGLIWANVASPEKAMKVVLSEEDSGKYEKALNSLDIKKQGNSNFRKAIHQLVALLSQQLNQLTEQKRSIVEWYSDFVDLFFTKTKVIKVTLESMKDAYETFERLNDRGVKLSVFDLLNIKLTKRIMEDKDQQKIYADSITRLKQLCEDTGVKPHDALQKYFMLTKKAISVKELPDEFDTEWSDFDKVLKGLEEVTETLDAYKNIFSTGRKTASHNPFLQSGSEYYFKDVEIYKTLQTPYFKIPIAFVYAKMKKSGIGSQELQRKMNLIGSLAYKVSWNANAFNSSMGVLLNAKLKEIADYIVEDKANPFPGIDLNVQMEQGITGKSLTDVILLSAVFYEEMLKGEYTPLEVSKANVEEPEDETTLEKIKKIKIKNEKIDFDIEKFRAKIPKLRQLLDWKDA